MSISDPIINITPVIVWNASSLEQVSIPEAQRGQHTNSYRWIFLPAGIHTVMIDSSLPFALRIRSSDDGSVSKFFDRKIVPANPATPQMVTLIVSSELGGYLTVHPSTEQSEAAIAALTTKAFGIRIILGEARGSGVAEP